MASIKDLWSWLIGTKDSALEVIKSSANTPHQTISISKTDGVTIEYTDPPKAPKAPVPKVEAPKVEIKPAAPAPVVPKVEPPKVEVKPVEAPKLEAPKKAKKAKKK